MGKISNVFRDLSIKKSIVCYMIIFIIIAVALCAVTSYTCNVIENNIRDKYPQDSSHYYLTTEDGEILGSEGVYISNSDVNFSEKDKTIVDIVQVLPNILNPIYSVICAILAVFVFYNSKLKEPLAELNNASSMIANNNLDFSVNYQSKDEMGKLCESFEKMRTALLENYKEMWRQVEERKKLNSAFAHELRTPLTILKGYNEMLSNNNEIKNKDTIKVMAKNIDRMEKYVETMSTMRKIEEVKPNIQIVNIKYFYNTIEESVKIMCNNDIKVEIRNNVNSENLSFDSNMILQVFNNLISNSMRYANSLIQVEMKEDIDNIYIIVKDDGKGFSKKAIESATTPYFSESQEDSSNFGLGLYISKVYCELNNGKLELYNEIGACAKISLKKF